MSNLVLTDCLEFSHLFVRSPWCLRRSHNKNRIGCQIWLSLTVVNFPTHLCAVHDVCEGPTTRIALRRFDGESGGYLMTQLSTFPYQCR
ncbi:hypothetical protein AVEN_113301-1 [Araneus ventricosus]|uniref:Uncharacterized protein n=1 Tax=Araneus ventricosus TaxID=182803 RepID=A0A4Y2GNP3_ARAVE|nr:hypothetical protein AVEN_113301-1 [Araneus ventricosus]